MNIAHCTSPNSNRTHTHNLWIKLLILLFCGFVCRIAWCVLLFLSLFHIHSVAVRWKNRKQNDYRLFHLNIVRAVQMCVCMCSFINMHLNVLGGKLSWKTVTQRANFSAFVENIKNLFTHWMCNYSFWRSLPCLFSETQSNARCHKWVI